MANDDLKEGFKRPAGAEAVSPKQKPRSQQQVLQVPNGLGDVLAQRDRTGKEQSEMLRVQAAAARREQQMLSIAVNYSDEQLEADLAYMIQGRLMSNEMSHAEFSSFVVEAAESNRLLPETIEVLQSIQSNDLKLSMQQNALLAIFQGIMQSYRTNMAPAPMPALMVSENVPLLSSAH